MKRFITTGVLGVLLLLLIGLPVSADAIEGETIITLGEDLTEEQKEQMLEELGATEDTAIIYVTNEEEHQYLGDFVSASQIGTKAISSSKIVLAEEGFGIQVHTDNINQITESMYRNALITAGVTDAEVYVTAPFEVSGTAGLTGLTKAYEQATDVEISEEQKKVANEEMVVTSELADDLGEEEAAELVNKIKEEMAENPVESEDEIRDMIINITVDMDINISDESIDKLVKLFSNMQKAGIDWGSVKEGLSSLKDGVTDFVSSDEAQSIFGKIADWFGKVFSAIGSWFSNLFS